VSDSLDLKLDLMLGDKPLAVIPQGQNHLTTEGGLHLTTEGGSRLTTEDGN
jgi:hypothetical protein